MGFFPKFFNGFDLGDDNNFFDDNTNPQNMSILPFPHLVHIFHNIENNVEDDDVVDSNSNSSTPPPPPATTTTAFSLIHPLFICLTFSMSTAHQDSSAPHLTQELYTFRT